MNLSNFISKPMTFSATALFCATSIGSMAVPNVAVAHDLEVLFQSQPQIPSPGNCVSKGIPRSDLKLPNNTSDKAYTAFFGVWCRETHHRMEDVAVVPHDKFDGKKKAYAIKFLTSINGASPRTGWGIIFWDARQGRWTLSTKDAIFWLQSNRRMAGGRANASVDAMRTGKIWVAKGKKADWVSYRKVE